MYAERERNQYIKTIVVVQEQGNGDLLMMTRYLKMLKDLGATVKIVCNSPLVNLLKSQHYVDLACD